MTPRVLILTAGFGEGHNAAARAVAAACDARHGVGTAYIADVFELASPRLNTVMRRSYLGLINRTPKLWSYAYDWIDRSTTLPRLLRFMGRETRVLQALIEGEQPQAICCTYPIYAFLLDALARKRRLHVPFFNVVTDSISINSLWWRAGATRWFLPNEDSAEVLSEAGIEERRIQVTGFPVTPFFAAHTGKLSPPELGRGAIPRVLYIINSGTPGAAQTARRLLQETRWEITCTVGRNPGLQRELETLAARRSAPTKIFGWTDEIPRLLMTHHVVISKAGGATTQEALAAGCPMIVNQIVPGQEEGNYELLRRHGIGALALTPEAVIAALTRAFAADGEIFRQWRSAIVPLSRPAAAVEIAHALLSAANDLNVVEPVPMPLRAGKVAASV